jgi:hypothetical protein
MIKCNDDCIPCCDFCIHAIHEEFEHNGDTILGGPIGCSLHEDTEHQDIAEACGYCEDFHCFLANQE